jgi:RND family efflux transporter MFP subunit
MAFPGLILASQTALLKSMRNEVVAKVTVSLGASVSKDQLLVQLVANEERVRRDRMSTYLERARADLKRIRSLHAEKLATDETLEEADAAVRIAEADYDLAQIQWEECFVRAPFDGIVAERYVDPGTSVETGDPLMRVTSLSPLRMEALLPETALHFLSEDSVIELIPAYPETTLYLPVHLESVVVDPASGTFPLHIEIENGERHLVPGVSCRLTIRSAAEDGP